MWKFTEQATANPHEPGLRAASSKQVKQVSGGTDLLLQSSQGRRLEVSRQSEFTSLPAEWRQIQGHYKEAGRMQDALKTKRWVSLAEGGRERWVVMAQAFLFPALWSQRQADP